MPYLGIYVPTVESIPPRDRLLMTKQAGFDFVCLGIGAAFEEKPHAITGPMCEEIGIECDNVHLTCNGAHALWADDPKGDAIIERWCREIDLATSWGIHVGIVHVTWGTKPPPPISAIGLSRFETVTRYAEKCGFTIAVENSVYLEYLHTVMAHLQSPNVGFCFDCGHHHAFAKGEELIARYGDRLCATHIHDNDGRKDLHLMSFDGNADFSRIARELAATELGKLRIASEAKGVHTQKYPEKSAEEVAAALGDIALAKTPELLRIEDGIATFYPGFSYEEMLQRQYRALTRVSDMILKAAQTV